MDQNIAIMFFSFHFHQPEIHCSSPPTLTRAVSDGFSTNVNDVIKYSCAEGSFKNGLSTMTIVCGIRGNWTVIYHTAVMEVPVEHAELDYLHGDCVG